MKGDSGGLGPDGRRGENLAPSIRTFGPYQISDLLGQGGMAAVYLARDTRDSSEVAVKVLARMRPSWVHRFSREFEAAKKVSHPNVVRVLESGEEDGVAYYSMERIHGVTASRYVRGLSASESLPPPPPMDFVGPTEPVDPMVLDRTLRVAVQLTRAVGAIHEVGIVHRDLKPGNVLVTDSGIVKLVDFGVVKWLEELNNFTQVGHVVGSYSYMSPEQITGTQVDHRADMYGMGVLLYELVTGAPPFRARRPQEYLWLHCTSQPNPVSRQLDGVPPQFDRLLLRLLAKEPSDRPESMTAIEAELLEILAEMQRRATEDVEVILEEDTEEVFRIENLDSSQEVTLSSGSVPSHSIAKPEDATLALDVSEFEALRGLHAQLKRQVPSPPGPELHFEDLSIDDDSPTAPLLAEELTESRVTPQSEYPKPSTGAAALAALVSPKHIGRREEIEVLLDALKATRKSGIHGVLIEGEAGIGKTRLLHTFRGLAWVKGAKVAIGPCDEGGETFCGAFQEILVRLAGPALSRGHRDRLLGPDKAILYRFFPKLIAENEEVTDPTLTLSGLEFDKAGLFRAVADTLRRASENGPLVVAIEDIHWADSGTARLADSLLRRLGPPNEAPLLLVFTFRAESVTDRVTPAKAFLDSLRQRSQVLQIALAPLEATEMRELIRSICVDVPMSPAVIRRLATAARGNPRFAVEVARTVIEAGGAANDTDDWGLPTTLLAAYKQRLADLPSTARDVARCIAILGGSPPLAIVLTASGLGGGEFEAAVSELERRRVADVDRRTETELTSLHSSALRAAVLDTISNAQARSLHRRAAAAWLKWAGRDPTISGHVARHFYAAGEDRVAIPHALRSAALASDAQDMTAVKRWMALLGDLNEITDELPQELVYSYYMLRWKVAFEEGQLDDAGPALEQAAGYAPDLRSSLETGQACARLHTREGRYTDAVRVCRRGLREARDGGVPEFSVRFSLQGARAARRSGDLESGLAWLAEADLTLNRHELPVELAVRSGWTRSAVLVDLGRAAEAEEEIHRVIKLSALSGEEDAEAGLRTNLSVLYFRRGAIEAATHELELAQTIFEAIGEPEQVGLSETNLAQLRLHQGRVAEATKLARSSWNTFERLGDRLGRLAAGQNLLFAALIGGDHPTAEMINQSLSEEPASKHYSGEAWAEFLMTQARWHQGQGSLAVAWNHMGRATRALGPLVTPPMRLRCTLLRAQLMWERKQLKEASPLLQSIIKEARQQGLTRLLCESLALGFATECSLGKAPQPMEDFTRLLGEDLLLKVAVSYFLWRGEEARKRPKAGARHWREGTDLAERCGFIYWKRRLAEPPTPNQN